MTTPTSIALTMSREEANDFYEAGGGLYYFAQATSYAGGRLASALRGGKKADPNVGPAIRIAEDLERRLETLAVVQNLPPSEELAMPRAVPADDDLPDLLSSASSDARYVKNLTRGGAGMFTSKATEALRVVRGLRPKLEAIWAIYETMPKPERLPMSSAAQAEFWRRLDAGMSEAEALRP